MYLKDNMQNRTISELYAGNKKAKYSSKPNDILKSTKTFMNNVALKDLQNCHF